MSNEVKRVKDIMVELMLTGRVEFFGKEYNQLKLETWAKLLQKEYVTISTHGKPKLTKEGRAWLERHTTK